MNNTTQVEGRQLTNSNIMIISIYAVIFTFGLIGNSLVIRYFGFKSNQRRLYHIYLIHLAVADLISSTVTPVYFIYGIVNNNIWRFGEVSCTIISATGPLTVNVSAWLLVSIAHERYRGIYSPLKLRMTKLRIHMTVGCIWIVSLIIFIPYMKSIQLMQGKYCILKWSRPVYELSYAVGTLLLQSIFPIIYMTFAMKRILYTLRNRMSLDNFRRKKNCKYSVSSCETSFISKQMITSCTSPTSAPTTIHEDNDQNFQETGRRISTDENFTSKIKNEQNFHKDIGMSGNKSGLFQSQNTLFKFFINRDSGNSSPKTLVRNNAIKTCSLSKYHDAESRHRLLLLTKSTPTLQKCIEKDDKSNKMFMKGDANNLPGTASSSVYKKVRTIFSFNQMSSNRVNRRRISMLIVTFCVFVVCSLPYNTFYVIAIIIYDLFNNSNQLDTLQNINLWLSTLVVANSIMNCFIYAGMDNYFKQYCLSLFNCRRKKKKRRV